jgi:hypothetical protein
MAQNGSPVISNITKNARALRVSLGSNPGLQHDAHLRHEQQNARNSIDRQNTPNPRVSPIAEPEQLDFDRLALNVARQRPSILTERQHTGDRVHNSSLQLAAVENSPSMVQSKASQAGRMLRHKSRTNRPALSQANSQATSRATSQTTPRIISRATPTSPPTPPPTSPPTPTTRTSRTISRGNGKAPHQGDETRLVIGVDYGTTFTGRQAGHLYIYI